MAEVTGIAWARSTFNPWIGCTEVSTEKNGGGGCDACYARELDKRHRWGGATHWGPGVPRLRTAPSTWGQPVAWNSKALEEQRTGVVPVHMVTGRPVWSGRPGFWPVFPSLCDPFDNEVDDQWHAAFWQLIRRTPALTWLLLTKRIANVEKMHPGGQHPNVWIGASVVNQKEADRDIPKLCAVNGFAKRFISHEPALGEIDWTGLLGGIDQVITGGESRQGLRKPRAFVIGWARTDRDACRAAGVAWFMKQMGSYAVNREGHHHTFKDRAGADPSEWPPDLRVQEFPRTPGVCQTAYNSA